MKKMNLLTIFLALLSVVVWCAMLLIYWRHDLSKWLDNRLGRGIPKGRPGEDVPKIRPEDLFKPRPSEKDGPQ